jgi:short-subunit dehydrogenase
LAFNRALVIELKGTSVTSTVFCPGPLKTGFAEQGGLASTRLYRYFSGDIHQQVAKAYQGMLKGKSTVVAGLINKILAFSGELPPRSIALSVNKFLLNK